jgi:hypothetical protein
MRLISGAHVERGFVWGGGEVLCRPWAAQSTRLVASAGLDWSGLWLTRSAGDLERPWRKGAGKRDEGGGPSGARVRERSGVGAERSIRTPSEKAV